MDTIQQNNRATTITTNKVGRVQRNIGRGCGKIFSKCYYQTKLVGWEEKERGLDKTQLYKMI